MGIVYDNIEQLDVQNYVKSGGTVFINFISRVGRVSLSVFLALILSLFFLLEKERIIVFGHAFKNSKISWIYNEIVYFSDKFTNSFGKVIQAQIIIALINAMLSTIFLTILRFPNLIGLFMLIFIFGMIPVAGVIISLFPLTIIAFSIGGPRYVLYVILMIIVLHSLEAYFLNPKLMSYNTKLPVFITFLILLVSEHFFGIWGLIVGIPITTFFLDILEVKVTPEKPDI
jgi:predicted PurR-regulated permease PerM